MPIRLVSQAALLVLTLAWIAGSAVAWGQSATDAAGPSYADRIAQDQPVIYLGFAKAEQKEVSGFALQTVGQVPLVEGPRRPDYPLFESQNQAGRFAGKNSYLRIADPGEKSGLDFDAGDTITIEAWVAPEQIKNGAFAYLIGKGRTYLPGVAKENHNWALRLKGVGGSAAVTFLFRSRGEKSEYHRWTSNGVLGVGDGWHHISLSYTFGKKDSLTATIDGKSTKGKWDLGGATDRAPVVDNDEVWVGSAMGGQAASSYRGDLDEVAVYRSTLDTARLADRFKYNAPQPAVVEVPRDQVLVQLFQGVPSSGTWNFRPPRLLESFTLPHLAIPELPKRYSARGIHIDRPSPLLVRAYADIVLPPGKQRLLIRSRDSARLFLDGKLLTETPFYKITAEANGAIWELARDHAPDIRPLQRGDRQAAVEVEGDGKPHRLRFETLVGLKNRRPELGEASVSVAAASGTFTIVGFGSRKHQLTESGWRDFLATYQSELAIRNRLRREQAGRAELAYWQARHELARQSLGKVDDPAAGIDRFIDAGLAQAELQPSEPLDDLAFLRRLALDVLGTVPSREQIRQYQNDPPATRRRLAIERFLNDPGWADHWVAYWQDVLAENPNIINPSLNNTGPFRWWIYESFRDNKPLDRFVTELVMMEGSQRYGGPGGFEMASSNDVPMAAKAHILGQAFLGVQMQCARCHDAPNHDVTQRDLFALAAMLKGQPQEVPKTSSINVSTEQLENLAVKVTLKPGAMVSPAWSFPQFIAAEVPPGVLRGGMNDSRERLAALITLPQNERFARVVVNRIWKRYLGKGLVEPVHDWEGAKPSHPELLDWLAHQFVTHDYDVKHVARLILQSELYGRQSVGDAGEEAFWFSGPLQRTLTAEQMLDSLFVISQKPYRAGPMAIDIDGARPDTVSLNLGRPRRAWMFTSTSNERDRPSLALPFAQPFVTFLQQFGWRGARQNPINQRPDDLTAQQPAEIANGIVAQRVTRMSDDHAFTELAMEEALTASQLVDELYLRIFTRSPSPREREIVLAVLQEKFETRRRPDAPLAERPRDRRGMISWSNHLEMLASEIKIELQEVVRRGDPPTQRLDSEWRGRLEDVVWSMINSPEFRFAP